MPPTASPGVRGTQTEFAPRSSFFETPTTAAMLRKMSPLVSWKNTSHLTPVPLPLSRQPACTRAAQENTTRPRASRCRQDGRDPRRTMRPRIHAGAAVCAHRRGRAAWYRSCRPCLCTPTARQCPVRADACATRRCLRAARSLPTPSRGDDYISQHATGVLAQSERAVRLGRHACSGTSPRGKALLRVLLSSVRCAKQR